MVDRPCSMRFLLGAEGGDEREQRRAAQRLSELRRTAERLLAGGGLLVTYKGVLERLELPDTSCRRCTSAICAGGTATSISIRL